MFRKIGKWEYKQGAWTNEHTIRSHYVEIKRMNVRLDGVYYRVSIRAKGTFPSMIINYYRHWNQAKQTAISLDSYLTNLYNALYNDLHR